MKKQEAMTERQALDKEVLDRLDQKAYELCKQISFKARSYKGMVDQLEARAERIIGDFSFEELGIIVCLRGREVILEFESVETNAYDLFITCAVEILLAQAWQTIRYQDSLVVPEHFVEQVWNEPVSQIQ